MLNNYSCIYIFSFLLLSQMSKGLIIQSMNWASLLFCKKKIKNYWKVFSYNNFDFILILVLLLLSLLLNLRVTIEYAFVRFQKLPL